MHYDCFNKDSGCLHTTPFTGNFDGICVFLHGYELFRTGSRSFELVAGGLGGCGYSWVDGCGWFRVVVDGFRWFRVVSDGFGWFVVLVVTKENSKPVPIIYPNSTQSSIVPKFPLTRRPPMKWIFQRDKHTDFVANDATSSLNYMTR